jgi:hypothetical protein
MSLPIPPHVNVQIETSFRGVDFSKVVTPPEPPPVYLSSKYVSCSELPDIFLDILVTEPFIRLEDETCYQYDSPSTEAISYTGSYSIEPDCTCVPPPPLISSKYVSCSELPDIFLDILVTEPFIRLEDETCYQYDSPSTEAISYTGSYIVEADCTCTPPTPVLISPIEIRYVDYQNTTSGLTFEQSFDAVRATIEANGGTKLTGNSYAKSDARWVSGTQKVWNIMRGYSSYDVTLLRKLFFNVTKTTRLTDGITSTFKLVYTQVDPAINFTGMDSWTEFASGDIVGSPSATDVNTTENFEFNVSALTGVVWVGIIMNNDKINSLTPEYPNPYNITLGQDPTFRARIQTTSVTGY